MRLSLGNKVFYRGCGPCLVGAIVHKVIGGSSADFYSLRLLGNTSGELLVPVNDHPDLQIRALIDPAEVSNVLDQLSMRSAEAETATTPKNRRQRGVEISQLFTSGSTLDLAGVLRLLTELSAVKMLVPHERNMLGRAKRLLICELSEVMNESKTAAEARIDNALSAGKSISIFSKHHVVCPKSSPSRSAGASSRQTNGSNIRYFPNRESGASRVFTTAKRT